MARHLLPYFLVCLNLACSSSGMFGGSNKPAGDGKRPTETGEGVPGYLTDPELVSVSRDAAKISVVGQSGAVRAQDANIDQLQICLFQFDPAKIQSTRLLESKSVELDGSFSVVGISDSEELRAAVQVGLECDMLSEENGSVTQTIFESEDGVFTETLNGPAPSAKFVCEDYGDCKDVSLAFLGSESMSISRLALNFPIDCQPADPYVLDSGSCAEGSGIEFGFQLGENRTDHVYQAEECRELETDAFRSDLFAYASNICKKSPRHELGSFSTSEIQLKLPQIPLLLDAYGNDGSEFFVELSKKAVTNAVGKPIQIPTGSSSH